MIYDVAYTIDPSWLSKEDIVELGGIPFRKSLELPVVGGNAAIVTNTNRRTILVFRIKKIARLERCRFRNRIIWKEASILLAVPGSMRKPLAHETYLADTAPVGKAYYLHPFIRRVNPPSTNSGSGNYAAAQEFLHYGTETRNDTRTPREKQLVEHYVEHCESKYASELYFFRRQIPLESGLLCRKAVNPRPRRGVS
jgi:hypothetical protein